MKLKFIMDRAESTCKDKSVKYELKRLRVLKFLPWPLARDFYQKFPKYIKKAVKIHKKSKDIALPFFS